MISLATGLFLHHKQISEILPIKFYRSNMALGQKSLGLEITRVNIKFSKKLSFEVEAYSLGQAVKELIKSEIENQSNGSSCTITTTKPNPIQQGWLHGSNGAIVLYQRPYPQ